MSIRKTHLAVTSCIILFPMLIGLLLWPRLPDTLAIHFALDGTPNGWGSKLSVVVGLPLILLVLHLVSMRVAANDSKSNNSGSKTLLALLLTLPTLCCVCMLVIYTKALGLPIDSAAIALLMTGLLLILVGNYLPKCHQNAVVGIKLPWTLHSPENWNRTHRLAARLFIAAGLIFWAGILFRSPWVIAAVLVLCVAIPTGYSYALHRKGI